MKRRRILAALPVSAMTVSMIGGCSGSGSQTTESGEAAQTTQAASETAGETEAAEMTTITVWNNAAHETSVREKQIEEFNNGEGKELGIYIDYQTYGDNYADTIKIAAQAGEAPELFSYDSKWGMDFIDAGYLVPLEDLPGSEELIEKFKPYLSNQGQVFNGKTYTLPYSCLLYTSRCV